MKLEKKHYYWIGAILIATAIGIAVYKKRQSKKKNAPKPKKFSGDISDAELIADFPLKLGSEGEQVKKVQTYLNSVCSADLKANNLFPLDVSGVWDENTEAATTNCYALKRNSIDEESFNRIDRDLKSANITL